MSAGIIRTLLVNFVIVVNWLLVGAALFVNAVILYSVSGPATSPMLWGMESFLTAYIFKDDTAGNMDVKLAAYYLMGYVQYFILFQSAMTVLLTIAVNKYQGMLITWIKITGAFIFMEWICVAIRLFFFTEHTYSYATPAGWIFFFFKIIWPILSIFTVTQFFIKFFNIRIQISTIAPDSDDNKTIDEILV